MTVTKEKIIHKETRLEVFFEHNPLHFSLVEEGTTLTNGNAQKVLNMINEENIMNDKLEVVCL
jgi:hypothetical protein